MAVDWNTDRRNSFSRQRGYFQVFAVSYFKMAFGFTVIGGNTVRLYCIVSDQSASSLK